MRAVCRRILKELNQLFNATRERRKMKKLASLKNEHHAFVRNILRQRLMAFSTLYYPKFEPEQDWLRAVLLFFDEIQRIIPAQAHHRDSRATQELMRVMPDAFFTVAPNENDKNFDDLNFSRLEKAFADIKARSEGRPTKKFLFTINREGDLQAMRGDVWLSNAKLHERVKQLLAEYNLATALPPSMSVFGDTFPANEEASNLIVSYIADRMAKRTGLDTITDTVLPHAVQTLDAMVPTAATLSREGEGLLAAAVATVAVPRGIAHMDVHQYQELRTSFGEIRPAFHELTRSLAAYGRLDKQQSAGALESRVERALAEYQRQMNAHKRTATARKIDEWVPLCFQGLLGIFGIFGPEALQVLMASSVVAVEVIKEKISGRSPESPHQDLFRMLCSLEKRIEEQEVVRRLL